MEIDQGLGFSKEESALMLNSELDSDFKLFWEKLSLLLKKDYNTSTSEQSGRRARKWLFVHATVSVKKCPSDVLRLVIKFFPEQLEIFDEDGKLPLHLALENGKSTEEIQILLQAYPLATSIATGNNAVYPFVLAALNDHDVATLFHLLKHCPELERFMCKGKISCASSRRSQRAIETKHKIQTVSLSYNDFGDENALQNIDCKEFDAALLKKKMRFCQSAY